MEPANEMNKEFVEEQNYERSRMRNMLIIFGGVAFIIIGIFIFYFASQVKHETISNNPAHLNFSNIELKLGNKTIENNISQTSKEIANNNPLNPTNNNTKIIIDSQTNIPTVYFNSG